MHTTSLDEYELWVLRNLDGTCPRWRMRHYIDTYNRDYWKFRPLAFLKGHNKLIMVSWPRFGIAVYDVISHWWKSPEVVDEEADEDEQSGIDFINSTFLMK